MNRITELRLKMKKSMMQVAKDLSIPYTTFVNYEKGEREPNSEMLIELANYFSVSVDYLIGRSDDSFSRKLSSPTITDNTITFPVFGEVAAGYDEIAVEDWSGETIEIPASYLKGRDKSEFFVLSVKGNSMYPQYQSGDRVLVLKQNTLNRSGDVGVILYGSDYATLKRVEYVYGEDWMRLIPINPEYIPKLIEGADLEQCRVLGVPRLIIRDLA